MSPIKAQMAHHSTTKAAAMARAVILLAAVSVTVALLYLQVASVSSSKSQTLFTADSATGGSVALLSQIKQQLQAMQSAGTDKAQLAQLQDLMSSTQRLISTAVHNCLKQPMDAQHLPGVLVAAPADGGVAITPKEQIAVAIAAESESVGLKDAIADATAKAVAAAAPAPAGPPPLIETPYVGSALVDFKGHKLQLVALKNDEVVGSWVLKEKKPYEPDYLNIILDYVKPGSVVVDAGANMGTYSTFFAARTGEQGAVYAFEPQKRMHQVLVTNMMINGLTWLHPINAALSYEKGVLHMQGTVTHGKTVGTAYTDADKSHQSINYGGQRLGAGGEEVQAVTLDSFNLTNVSLIKVDVQWAEKMMLYGARETIKRNLPVVSYELPDPNYLAALESEVHIPDEVRSFNYDQFLRDLGYTALDDFSLVNDRVMLPPKSAGRKLRFV